ncbi:hypothetical protein DLEV_120 [Diachasmimorpha longicaudata entomopoxvirus]|uniref:Uncharacterized protein n=1 Tax=Diachasmimorpha longicaudata entomopoxvirus TaxID=109981 RepID=A0A7R5WK60_9POXV|nr:hypothetical protein QKK69_gp120 [Diachasmimorpha longicaudata entomopoxvirus]AKS26411.1 hypothetical protein DLEV_120 [Diachasmimorpha longicaudata entomopoxvirus]
MYRIQSLIQNLIRKEYIIYSLLISTQPDIKRFRTRLVNKTISYFQKSESNQKIEK